MHAMTASILSPFADATTRNVRVGEARHLRQWWGRGATRILPGQLSRAWQFRARPAPFSEEGR
ncbi:hypothetical protein J2X65_002002 [Ancylobacter sp. 3268]|nr:hypothetical protein [Ancylobacter sp. 3268]